MKKYTGALGDFTPEMQTRALENQTRAPENRHRLQCKSLFNVADLVNGMPKVAPENKISPELYIGFKVVILIGNVTNEKLIEPP